ncbi:MAG: 4Fe-4S binding protein [Oscillospiraceae bacterium]|nr:4Fe-4S binding protein [Oscillospiraceae bacterium]
MISTVNELNERICSCTDALENGKYHDNSGKRHVLLCGGTGCLSSNSQAIYEKFCRVVKERGLEDRVTVNQVGCFGLCSQGPFVKIYPEDTLYRMVKDTDVEEIVDTDLARGELVEHLLYVDPRTQKPVQRQDDINFYKKQKRIALHGCGSIDPGNISEALGHGAFQGLRNALEMGREATIKTVLDSGLRGRGGGGFPTGRKWQFAYGYDSEEKYVVCNGDEGDPGAFMDRSILEGNPFAVLEGMMIAGYAIGAKHGYLYIRAEYPVAVAHVQEAIRQMEAEGLLGDNILGTGFSFRAQIRPGAGAFVCGEETALLNSVMGQRGMPSPRPPFPAERGLWQKPTIVNNVETMATVPYILREGVAAFTKYGTDRSHGTKVFALGGKINNVGLVEIPMGTTLRELIYDIGGGIPDDKEFKAIQTGGPSGGCLTAEYLDTPIDFDNMVALGSMMGSGGAIVMDEDNCMVDVAKFYMGFICDESCGKCVPCREGTRRMLEILQRITEGNGKPEDVDTLRDLADVISNTALCGLGKTSANPIISTLRAFEHEYREHIHDKHCRAGVCSKLREYVIDPEKCKGCSKCARNCPVNAISGKVREPYTINPQVCIKCGACIDNCAFGAIYYK